MMSLKFCFIGAGNLATQLSCALQTAGFEIVQVYSRTDHSAKVLAEKLKTHYTTQRPEIVKDADIYFVALKDSVVHEVLSKVNLEGKLLVHCSGSMPMSVLKQYSTNYGVVYPLQTFSKNREVNFSEIPVFVEANNTQIRNQLTEIAKNISNNVSDLNSEKRKSLHIAAVFACNFVNHFYALSAAYLEDQEISFDVMHPLILETARKAVEMPPKQAQTGPAIRFDENIINDHLKKLSNNPELKELYNSVSRSIFEFHQKRQ